MRATLLIKRVSQAVLHPPTIKTTVQLDFLRPKEGDATITRFQSGLSRNPYIHRRHLTSCMFCLCIVPADLFQLSSGPCTVTADHHCIRSSNFPWDYGNNQDCVFRSLQNVQLSVTAFNTEQGYDRLTVNGISYSGTTGPGGVVVAAGQDIVWISDHSVVATGFEICGAIATGATALCMCKSEGVGFGLLLRAAM